MAAAVAGPFDYTATGILGDKRDTMLENQLLLRVGIQISKKFEKLYSLKTSLTVSVTNVLKLKLL